MDRMENTMDIPEFGIKRENEERRDGGCAVIFDPKTQRYAVGERSEGGLFILFSGGINADEDIETAVLREVTEESGLHDFQYVEKIAEALTHYHNAPKNIDRVAHATCFLVILGSADTVPTKLEAHEDFSLRWVSPEEITANWRSRNENKDHDHWFYFLEKSLERAIALGYDKTNKKR
jgi:8-oxo-dGTP pyrophosphatase MutT (NUDIX family)